MSEPITSTDILIYCHLATTILGFVMLYLKLNDKMGKQGNRLVRLETNLYHVMRKLGMTARVADEIDQPLEENET